MKKVVIIAPYLYSLQRGIERFCINLSDAMVKKGCKVIIYTWGAKGNKPCGALNPDIRIRKVPYFRYFRDKLASWFYRFWLRKDNPDATILNFFYHGEEFLPKDKKYLYVLHSPASQVPQRYKYVRGKIKPFTNIHVVAISEMVRREALHYFGGKPMSLIYNGTDVELFKPIANKTSDGKLHIITPAAYEERKGMHYLIKALADYDHKGRIKYDIYGGGDETYGTYLKRLIEEHHLEDVVSLKGSVSNLHELEPKYDLFALLSKGEAFALTPIEAMASGLPILVSEHDPYPEFVKSEFGFMVDRNDTKKIQGILNMLIEQPEVLLKMSKAAREASLAFSWNTVVEQYLSLI